MAEEWTGGEYVADLEGGGPAYVWTDSAGNVLATTTPEPPSTPAGLPAGTPISTPSAAPSAEPILTPAQEVEMYGGSQEYLQVLQGMGDNAVQEYLQQLRTTQAMDVQEIQENVDPATLSQSARAYIEHQIAISPQPITQEEYIANIKQQTQVEPLTLDYEQSRKEYVKATGGNIDYYRSLAEPDRDIYLGQLQETQRMDVEEYVQRAGGQPALTYLEQLKEADIKTQEERGTLGTATQEYLQQLQATGEMDVEEFKTAHVQVGDPSKNEWMLKSDYDALPSDIKQTIDRIGISGYREQISGYEETLSPYQTTLAAIYNLTEEDLNKLTPGFRERYTAPYYDLSRISLEDAEKTEVREAVAALYPSLNLEQLGKQPLDSEAYEQLKAAHDRNLTGKYNGIEISDWYKYYPITALSPMEYQARRETLVNSGLSINEVNKAMSNYYMATGDIEEYQEFAKNQSLDVAFQPSTWQQMTPWREEVGQSVTLQGGTTMAMDILVPGYFVATNWDDLSPSAKGVNIAIDVVSLIPFIGAATLGARGVGTVSRAARFAAAGRAVASEAASQVVSPVTMLIHPIGTIKATYRTLSDVLEDVLDPMKLGEAVLTTSNHTVKLRVGKDITLAEAKAFGDELVNALQMEARQTGRPSNVVLEIMNDTGSGVRVEFPQSPLMREVGGGVTSGTPFGEEWMRQVDEQGFAVVSAKSEGGKMYFSLEPHSRFAFSTAGGIEGTSPTMLVFDRESTLFKNIEASQKLYKAPGVGLTKEVEVTAPAGTIVLDRVPEQILYTRVGVGREVMEIWLTKPLTTQQLAKLRALNLIERVKAPFKAPVKVTRIGEELEGLTEAELRTLANIVDDAGNVQVARRLRAVADSRDVFAVGTRVGRTVSLDRFDPVTGRVRSVEEPRVFRTDDLRRITGLREEPRRIIEREIPLRETPERFIPYREIPTREIPTREEPRREESRRDEPRRDTPRREEPRREPFREVPPRITPPRIPSPPIPPRRPPSPPPDYPIKKSPFFLDEWGGYTSLSAEEREGTVAWRQGIMYKLIYPPYGQEHIINSRKPFPNMKIHTGAESAFKTLVQRGKGKLPKTIKRDMGIMDITIVTGGGKGKKPKMKYKLDRYQSTDTTPRITRM